MACISYSWTKPTLALVFSCSLKILHALAVIKTSILQAKPVLAGIKYGMNCFVLLSDISEHLGSFIRPRQGTSSRISGGFKIHPKKLSINIYNSFRANCSADDLRSIFSRNVMRPSAAAISGCWPRGRSFRR